MKDKMQNKILQKDAKKHLIHFKYSFIIKTPSESGIKGTDFNILKSTYTKSTGSMMLSEEKQTFSPKDHDKPRMSSLTISS